nr:MAG TPA: hypothetical protein [Caudoviricetes sp.]
MYYNNRGLGHSNASYCDKKRVCHCMPSDTHIGLFWQFLQQSCNSKVGYNKFSDFFFPQRQLLESQYTDYWHSIARVDITKYKPLLPFQYPFLILLCQSLLHCHEAMKKRRKHGHILLGISTFISGIGIGMHTG